MVAGAGAGSSLTRSGVLGVDAFFEGELEGFVAVLDPNRLVVLLTGLKINVA